MPVKTRRFEGNPADIARSKERTANKRVARSATADLDEEEETPEEAAYRREQELLNEQSDELKLEDEDLAWTGIGRRI